MKGNHIKIAINGLYIRWGVNGGTETYFTETVRRWYDGSPSESNSVEIELFCSAPPPWWSGSRPHFTLVLIPFARGSLVRRVIAEQVLLPIKIKRRGTVVFNPGYVGIAFCRSPQVTTVHDGFAWVFPKEIGFFRALYWKTFIPFTAKRSARIIAVSQSTSNDIVRFCRLPQSRVTVIHEGGVDEGASYSNDVIDDLGLQGKPFFHCVGFFKKIKNPLRILEAFKSFRGDKRFEDFRLVLVGRVADPENDEILRYARTIPGVVWSGRIDDSQLRGLYRISKGLIFPSLYEGFGIPILEAQSLGCPVLCSNVSSMPEVAGDAALLVDPLSEDEISRAMKQLAGGDSSQLIESGFRNVANFSWEKSSRKTLELLIEQHKREGRI